MSETDSAPPAEHDGGTGRDGPPVGRPPDGRGHDGLPLDVTFEILRNSRRRQVLEFLRGREDRTASISELAEHVAAIENDTTVDRLNAQQRKRVYIGLYQSHLPKMDDAGVVDFEQSRGRVELDPAAEPLFEYIDVDGTLDEDDGGTLPAGRVAAATLATGTAFAGAQIAGRTGLAALVVFGFLGYLAYRVLRTQVG
ncbi:DUF7344 domain-containing protein [Halobaculum sp. EA56]|uniref:DUF7344 domain-containing protein n=1 Tax=Halobaculum sp. EA56 TaxID=3421648 RepID=UPI003EB96CB1